jgi:hypothetical protein
MIHRYERKRVRPVRPVLDQLEGRALLNAGVPHDVAELRAHADALVVKHNVAAHPDQLLAPPAMFTPISVVAGGGYRFLNFDGPDAGVTPGNGTNINGISNNGTVVGTSLADDGTFVNFTTNFPPARTAQILNVNGATNAMAFGVNSGGVVVGTDGNGDAFYSKLGTTSFIPSGTSAVAFGINDGGKIVGQYFITDNIQPGFVQTVPGQYITINAPSNIHDVVNAQGINNHGLVVGFYVGNDGNDHGFMLNIGSTKSGVLTGHPISDPQIPAVPGEPGATFVFSQVLGINDEGIAVGYYGDSTGSQHGFLYNTHTGQYAFLDDPSEAFDGNGVEVTQITGINNSGEITGFYTDANGVAHGFVAAGVPSFPTPPPPPPDQG